MKTKKIIIISITIFLFLISCKRTNKTVSNNEELFCLPGFIWIDYVGITNKIKPFTLIRTSGNDSSFVPYYKEAWQGFDDDTTFFNIYCNNYITDSKQFYELKKYIISHNTYKKEELINIDNYNAIKIAIIDQCDSIEYVVNSKEKGYFSNMIDSLEIKENSFIRYLNYYETIIN